MLTLALFSRMKRRFLNEDAQDIIEYGFIVALVSFGCIAAVHGIAAAVSNVFTAVENTISSQI